MKRLIVVSLLLLTFISSFGTDDSKLDSIRNIISSPGSSAQQKATAYLSAADLLYVNNIDTVLYLSNQALSLLDSSGSKTNSPREVLLLKANAINNIGFVYNSYGALPNALRLFINALKIREQVNDKVGIVESMNNIASVYKNKGDTAYALNYYNRALEIAQQIKDKKGEANLLNNIAVIYNNNHLNLNKALDYYQKALEVETTLDDLPGMAKLFHNIAVVYHEMDKPELAMEFYKKSIGIKEILQDQRGLINTYNSIARLYFDLNHAREAEENGRKALTLAYEIESTYGVITASQMLYEIYSHQHKWKEALNMHETYTRYRDQQTDESNSDQITKMQMQFEFDKRLVADSIHTVQEKKIIDEQFRTEKLKRNVLFIGLLIILVFSIIIFRRFKVEKEQKTIIELKEKETQLQKEIIEEKHKEITDSINYAERIQRSFLATEDFLNQYLNDYFIFFKPKDVVSGDFYWADQLANGKFIFVTADSTGHGVPGAIMSLLNINSLAKAIETSADPAEILNISRSTIIERLKRDGSTDGGKDGMDCAVCIYDFKTLQLTVAAANNPIWIVSEGNLTEIKADKMPVGKHDKQNTSFTSHHIQLKKGDIVYTLTDGFPDQFGGEHGKKFMIKNLRELIKQNSNLLMKNQQQILNETFVTWKGSLEQVDDVTIIGIRV